MRNELLINGVIILIIGLLLFLIGNNEIKTFESIIGQLAVLASSEYKMRYEFYRNVELIGIITLILGLFSLVASFIPGDSPREIRRKDDSQNHIYKKLKDIYYQMGISIIHEDEPNYFQANQTSSWKIPFNSDNTITNLDHNEYKIRIDLEIPVSNQIGSTIATVVMLPASIISLYLYSISTDSIIKLSGYLVGYFSFGVFIFLVIVGTYYELTKYNTIDKMLNRM